MKRNAFDSVTVHFAMTNMYGINVHTIDFIFNFQVKTIRTLCTLVFPFIR